MAVVRNQNEENENSQAASNDGSNPIQTLSSNTGVTAPGGSATQQNSANANPNRKGSGRFTNLTKYLDANKGQNLGSRVGSNYENKTKQQTINIQTDARNFQETNLNPYEEKVNKSGEYSKQLLEDPTQIDVNGFRDITTGKIKDDLGRVDTSLTQTANRVGDYQNKLGTFKNETGRLNMLSDVFGSGNNKQAYTGGMRGLDQLFLQADPKSYQSLQNSLNNQSTQLSDQLKDTRNDIQRRISGLQGRADGAATELTTKLADENDKLFSSQDAEIEALKTGNAELLTRLNQQIEPGGIGKTFTLSPTAGRIDDDMLAMLGMTHGMTYNPSLIRAAISDDPNAKVSTDRASYFNDQEAARAAAFSALAGENKVYSPGANSAAKAALQFNDGYDPSRLNTEIQNFTKKYEEERTPLEQDYGHKEYLSKNLRKAVEGDPEALKLVKYHWPELFGQLFSLRNDGSTQLEQNRALASQYEANTADAFKRLNSFTNAFQRRSRTS